MNRVGAALGGVAFVVAVFGGLVAVRIVTRALCAAVLSSKPSPRSPSPR